jgi:rod shape-determining protein MreC
MEYNPPPLFKQGASARARMLLFALLAMALLLADARLHALSLIRQGVGIVLYPLQSVALLPRDAFFGAAEYVATLSTLKEENRAIRQRELQNAQQLQQTRQLLAENAHLRELLGASERVQMKTALAEILYDARDPFSRKVIIDRGTRHGLQPGQPVIDEAGVVGQVTRTLPFTAEVTLLTDKDHAIPVQVVRSGVRGVAYGLGRTGELELRFMAANADIVKGDVLTTSGIDGVYPAGLAVATVTSISGKTSDMFARILCAPAAGMSRHRQLLVLLGGHPADAGAHAADAGAHVTPVPAASESVPVHTPPGATPTAGTSEPASAEPPAAAATTPPAPKETAK